MDSQPTYDNLPWDMIVSALQGILSPDEDLQFRQWLASSRDNQEKFEQLQLIWKDGLADYPLYREADEVKGWTLLAERIDAPPQKDAKVISRPFAQSPSLIRRLAIAAALVLAAGGGWWYLARQRNALRYETAHNEQKKISLPDGSTVVLNPQSRIELANSYSKTARTVILSEGEAYFEVSRQKQLPFVVDMDAASVKDIGTSFTVQKTPDSIKVLVSAGKVAFIDKETGESREISAGGSLCLYTAAHHFGELQSTGLTGSNDASLQFFNSPLSDVIAALQQASGKKILVNDSAIEQKRLTAHLGGESFDNAIKIICASLNLEYAEKDGIYILRNKDNTIH